MLTQTAIADRQHNAGRRIHQSDGGPAAGRTPSAAAAAPAELRERAATATAAHRPAAATRAACEPRAGQTMTRVPQRACQPADTAGPALGGPVSGIRPSPSAASQLRGGDR